MNYYQGIKTVLRSPSMLPSLEASGNYIVEPKMDGIWVSIFTDKNGKIVKIISRTGKEKSTKGFSFFIGKNIKAKNSILIGELITKNNKLYLFDIVKYKGKNITKYIIDKRRKLLERLKIYSTNIKLVPQFKDNFVARYNEVIKNGGEGLVIKKIGKGTHYKPGARTEEWMKIKPKITMDYVITGFDTSESKKYSGMVKAIHLGLYKDGKLINVGKVGSMKESDRNYITKNKQKLLGKIIEVGGNQLYKSGAMRHPHFIRIRNDLSKRDATFDKIKIVENFEKASDLLQEEMSFQRAKKVASSIKRLLAPAVKKIEIVGSLSRYHPLVKDIDIVVVEKTPIREFLKKKHVKITSGKEKAVNFEYKGVPVNIWITPEDSFGATVLHFSSGKGIIQIKNQAKRAGMTLNRYGLYKNGKKIAGKDYNKILRILNTSTKFKKIKDIEKAIENVPPKNRKKFINQGQFPRETKNYYRFRQLDPSKIIDGTYKIIKKKSGNALVVGKSKDTNKWVVQSVLLNKKNISRKDLDAYLYIMLEA